jgi:hypothetical protein
MLEKDYLVELLLFIHLKKSNLFQMKIQLLEIQFYMEQLQENYLHQDKQEKDLQ